MADETDPVASEEVVLRRIPNLPNYVNFDFPRPIIRIAFRPSTGDDDGLSLFRSLFTSPGEVANGGKNVRGYYVASLAVADIAALGLTVIADPLPNGPRGHSLIPEIRIDTNSATAIEQSKLAELASANIVFKPE